jgi:two-component system, NarL family, invasion response regulator UvrY
MQTNHMQKQIRIILVDDHQAIRESWKLLLEKNGRFIVIGQCNDGGDAIEQAHRLLPDVMLMDINMNHVNGFEATRKIMEKNPSVKIIGISVNNHPGYAAKMIGLGAKGFVTKSSPFAELETAILKVYKGEHYICDEIRNDSYYRQRS